MELSSRCKTVQLCQLKLLLTWYERVGGESHRVDVNSQRVDDSERIESQLISAEFLTLLQSHVLTTLNAWVEGMSLARAYAS